MKTIKRYELKVNQSDLPQMKINGSSDAYEYIKQFYSDDIHIYESSFVLMMNRNNTVIGYAKISQGGVTGTVVDTKIVLKYVIDSLSTAFIIAHNHPSGNMKPSEEDKRLTKRLKEICGYIDCQMLDHLILTSESYYSFADNFDL